MPARERVGLIPVLTPAALRAGRVDELLQAYDRERRVLPPPVSVWQWGWTKSAETWNGRIGAPCMQWPCSACLVHAGRCSCLIYNLL